MGGKNQAREYPVIRGHVLVVVELGWIFLLVVGWVVAILAICKGDR